MNTTRIRTTAAASAALLFCAQVASAHPGHAGDGGSGLAAGIAHPFSGIDHILAMIAVGLCAAQVGGRMLWLLPATFIAFMVGGGLLALGGTPVPMIEQGIAASVLVLGLLVAAGSRLATPAITGLVALFAIFHGYAHGAEMHAGLAPAAYAAGFVAATAMLHAIGLGTGLLLKRNASTAPSRLAGAAIALCGLVLLAT